MTTPPEQVLTLPRNPTPKKMSIAKNPPTFSLSKNYDDYKQELEIWSQVTTVDMAKQGMVIALNLPENGECEDIRNKVFRGCDVKGENGYANYVKFMDKHFKTCVH